MFDTQWDRANEIERTESIAREQIISRLHEPFNVRIADDFYDMINTVDNDELLEAIVEVILGHDDLMAHNVHILQSRYAECVDRYAELRKFHEAQLL